MDNVTLEAKWPGIYKQLSLIKQNIEKVYHDAMDIEFTIEEGKLYILSVRPCKRNIKAKVVIALDMFHENIITPDDILKRLDLDDIIEYLKPTIINDSELMKIGFGLPAYVGAVSGIAISTSEDINKFVCKSPKRYIVVKNEISPEDIDIISNAAGIVTTRGGMTSHASLLARGWRKPCIVSCNFNTLGISNNTQAIKSLIGNKITIDGLSGTLYKGFAEINLPKWKNDFYMLTLSKIVDFAIKTNNIPSGHIGNCWNLRDYFVHNIITQKRISGKRSVNSPKGFNSFSQPHKIKIDEILSLIVDIGEGDCREYTSCITGLRKTLLRTLSSNVGIGKHYLYYKPVVDPLLTIIDNNDSHFDHESKIQLISESFFNINKYLKHIPNINEVNINILNEVKHDEELSFLDYTNPKGASLVDNLGKIIGCSIYIDGVNVDYKSIPLFYHDLRKREYFSSLEASRYNYE